MGVVHTIGHSTRSVGELVEPAELDGDAVIRPDRTVHYPAAQANLF